MLSPTLFYFLKVVPGEFACFRGFCFAKWGGVPSALVGSPRGSEGGGTLYGGRGDFSRGAGGKGGGTQGVGVSMGGNRTSRGGAVIIVGRQRDVAIV